MPRHFVNSMANFMIQGGIVSFTLQDQAMRTDGAKPAAAPPETVADIVMREAEFAQLVAFFNQHVAAFEEQTGRKLGALPQAGEPGPKRPAKGQGSSMKIRPRSE